mmetsp:Transcript_95762/g.271016  ORF Transcript_95762/g.271016 Transcript_95762/m.271016 type:complete len:365 (-) Transcript_95762:328-1422(-)
MKDEQSAQGFQARPQVTTSKMDVQPGEKATSTPPWRSYQDRVLRRVRAEASVRDVEVSVVFEDAPRRHIEDAVAAGIVLVLRLEHTLSESTHHAVLVLPAWEPNLSARVVITAVVWLTIRGRRARAAQGPVWYEVVIVHDPKDDREPGVDVSRQGAIAHPWLPEGIDHWLRDTIDGEQVRHQQGHRSSKTVTSGPDLAIHAFFLQGRHGLKYPRIQGRRRAEEETIGLGADGGVHVHQIGVVELINNLGNRIRATESENDALALRVYSDKAEGCVPRASVVLEGFGHGERVRHLRRRLVSVCGRRGSDHVNGVGVLEGSLTRLRRWTVRELRNVGVGAARVHKTTRFVATLVDWAPVAVGNHHE